MKSNSLLNNIAIEGQLNEKVDISSLFQSNPVVYKKKFRGIVINASSEVPNDGNIHIFIDQIPPKTSFEILNAPDDMYGFSSMYIVRTETTSASDFDEVYEYLIQQGFTEEHVDMNVYNPLCSFNRFAATSKPSTVNAYIRSIIRAVKEFWEAKYPSKLFPEKYEAEIMNYSKILQIIFISNQICADPRENYQLLEYIGDQAGWSAMNTIFINFLEQVPRPVDDDGKPIELNQNNITSMHRDLFSKNVQAKLAKKLGVKQFIQTTGEMVNKIYGDIYEAMLGAFLLIDFQISTRVRYETGAQGKRELFQFHVAFLEWCYESVDLSKFEKKPYYTQFNESVTALFGGSYFEHINTRGIKIVLLRGKEKAMKELLEKGKEYKFLTDFTTTKGVKIKAGQIVDVAEQFSEIIKLATKKVDGGDDNLNFLDNEREKFNHINRLISEWFGDAEIIARKTMNIMKDWSDEQKQEFLTLMDQEYKNDYVLNKHFGNKLNTSYYWVVETVKDKVVLYSTLNFTNCEDPDVLISLIREKKMDTEEIECPEFKRFKEDETYVSYEGDNTEIFDKKYRDKNGLFKARQVSEGEGSSDISMEQLLREFDMLTLHISIRKFANDTEPSQGSHHGYLNYTPHPKNIFVDGFDYDEFFQRFVKAVPYKIANDRYVIAAKSVEVAKKPILSFIGDRLSNRAYLLVSLMRHGIMNEHHLTKVKNYLRSEILKKHFTFLMYKYVESVNGVDMTDNLDFDEYIGIAPEKFEDLLYELFKHVRIEDSFIETPNEKLKKIRYAIDKTTYNKSQQVIETVHDTTANRYYYVYSSSTGWKLSCEIGYRQTIILRDLFARYCMEYEMSFKDKVTLLTRLNSVFKNINGYDKLRQIMEIKNVEDWEILSTPKFDMRYTVKYKENNAYVYVTEKSFDEIVQTITNTRVQK